MTRFQRGAPTHVVLRSHDFTHIWPARGAWCAARVPLNITREELDAWADWVAGESLDVGLWGFAAAGLVGRDSSERAVLDLARKSPVSARIPISITGRDGFTKATIGSIDDDLDGRTVHYATQILSQGAPRLNLAWERVY